MAMKRLQIMIEPESDERLGLIALVEGRSKASIIRELIDDRLGERVPLEDDPITKLAGTMDFEPVHHNVIYE
jgi:predicted DNA-binding protein